MLLKTLVDLEEVKKVLENAYDDVEEVLDLQSDEVLTSIRADVREASYASANEVIDGVAVLYCEIGNVGYEYIDRCTVERYVDTTDSEYYAVEVHFSIILDKDGDADWIDIKEV